MVFLGFLVVFPEWVFHAGGEALQQGEGGVDAESDDGEPEEHRQDLLPANVEVEWRVAKGLQGTGEGDEDQAEAANPCRRIVQWVVLCLGQHTEASIDSEATDEG